MSTARIVGPTVALNAEGIAAYPATGSDNKALPTRPVAQLQPMDALVAKSDIGLGRSVETDNFQWQAWAAPTAKSIKRRNEHPDATARIVGWTTGDLVRYGVSNSTTTQKLPKGHPI
jgi:pilus assembly protein CpaB